MQGMKHELTQNLVTERPFSQISEPSDHSEKASGETPIFNDEFQGFFSRQKTKLHSENQLTLEHRIIEDLLAKKQCGNTLLERFTPSTRSSISIPPANNLTCDVSSQEINRHAQRLETLKINNVAEADEESAYAGFENKILTHQATGVFEHIQQPAQKQSYSLAISYGVESEQGKRPAMEDTYAHCISTDGRFEFFGIFDGHGGCKTAQVLAVGIENCLQPLNHVMLDLLAQRNPTNEIEIAHTLKETIITVDKSLAPHVATSGSTAIIALIDKQTSTLYLINLGDSRAIVGNNQGELAPLACLVDDNFTAQYFATDDHKPEKDCHKIKAAGSFVFSGRLDGLLALSRAFGDFSFKSTPAMTDHMRNADIYMKKITQEDSFIVLGSDGLWDVISNDVVAREVHARKVIGRNAQEAVHDIEQLAVSHYRQRDNVTTIVVYLNQAP